MASRPPPFVDVRGRSHSNLSNGLPSPRLHVAGEVPPNLSPLDAFALQSRLLAQQLNASAAEGRRASRLSPVDVAASLNARPDFFRAFSADAAAPPTSSPNVAEMRRMEAPLADRPISHYPRLSNTSSTRRIPFDPTDEAAEDDDWGVQSPVSITSEWSERGGPGGPPYVSSPSHHYQPQAQPRSNIDLGPQYQNRPLDASFSSQGYDSRALAPPRSPFTARSPRAASIRSIDSQEDASAPPSSGRPFQPQRQPSQNNLSTSPISPRSTPLQRSPSISSEMSLSGQLPRPTFNFSRPISRASMAPIELPSRQASSDSQPFVLADDTVHTPVSVNTEDFPDTVGGTDPAPSYIYSRYALPRGKMLQRNSVIFQDGPQGEQQWEQPRPQFSNGQAASPSLGSTPPSPPSRPSTSSVGQSSATSMSDSFEMNREPQRPSTERGRSRWEIPMSNHSSAPSVASGSTIKAPASLSSNMPATTEESAEDHVTKAIECHENGSLSESTYHLRIAAHQGHPTGMLLYALACRHGWGMRANQKEGVQWLRKAADCASLEVADDQDATKEGKHVDFMERKTRQAQFALSIYELGVSHMNGWGIEQDKTLALRCFEIAGSWGDGDALAEAGFCYAQGMGCKKDLKKSAQFYRQAEAKGISMVGNSWIYKAKYNDDAPDSRGRSDSKKGASPKKARSKSRSRHMFGRKKST